MLKKRRINFLIVAIFLVINKERDIAAAQSDSKIIQSVNISANKKY
jgi:hypothetical protein